MKSKLRQIGARYFFSISWIGIGIISVIPSQLLRKLVLKALFDMKISMQSILYSRFRLFKPSKITIGKFSVIGHNVTLDGRGTLKIGNNVNIGTGVIIYTAEHDYNNPNFKVQLAPVVIEDYVWISAKAIILQGVTIKKGAVIAAGAVVCNDVNEYTVVGGVPARIINKRNKDFRYNPASKTLPFI